MHEYSDEHDDREALQEEECGDSDEVHGDKDDDVDDDPRAWDPKCGFGDDEEVVDDDDPSIWDPDYGCGDEEEVDSDDPGQWDSDYYDHLFEEAAGRGTSGTAEDQTAEAIDEDEYVCPLLARGGTHGVHREADVGVKTVSRCIYAEKKTSGAACVWCDDRDTLTHYIACHILWQFAISIVRQESSIRIEASGKRLC